jgi:hypothetical protein
LAKETLQTSILGGDPYNPFSVGFFPDSTNLKNHLTCKTLEYTVEAEADTIDRERL